MRYVLVVVVETELKTARATDLQRRGSALVVRGFLETPEAAHRARKTHLVTIGYRRPSAEISDSSCIVCGSGRDTNRSHRIARRIDAVQPPPRRPAFHLAVEVEHRVAAVGEADFVPVFGEIGVAAVFLG